MTVINFLYLSYIHSCKLKCITQLHTCTLLLFYSKLREPKQLHINSIVLCASKIDVHVQIYSPRLLCSSFVQKKKPQNKNTVLFILPDLSRVSRPNEIGREERPNRRGISNELQCASVSSS